MSSLVYHLFSSLSFSEIFAIVRSLNPLYWIEMRQNHVPDFDALFDCRILTIRSIVLIFHSCHTFQNPLLRYSMVSFCVTFIQCGYLIGDRNLPTFIVMLSISLLTPTICNHYILHHAFHFDWPLNWFFCFIFTFRWKAHLKWFLYEFLSVGGILRFDFINYTIEMKCI